MSLTLNNAELSFNSNEPLELMDVQSFVEIFKYEIDKLYVDKFWNTINDNVWMVADYEMLRLMGYNAARDRTNKEKYLKLLSNNFVEGDGYDIIFETDQRIGDRMVAGKNTIIVHPKTFKDSLMMLQTEYAKSIRDNYLLVEEIHKSYTIYSKFTTSHNATCEPITTIATNMKPLVYNSTTISIAEDEPMELMNVNSFVEVFKYDIDKLYIDKFWNSLNNNEWVVIDYDMLKWIGYTNARDTDKKKYYLQMLKNNFTTGKDYDMISQVDVRIGVLKHPNKNTIIVHPRTFKKTLMMLRTEKSESIRDYYLMLEDILLDYVRYSKFQSEHNSNLQILKLERKLITNAQLPFDIDTEPVVCNEFVYVLTNQKYYKQCLFKIGKSVNLKNRLVTYNTGAAIKADEMFYLAKIPTFDCSALEKLIHQALDQYRFRKEWFHLPQHHMFEIIKLVLAQQIALRDKINKLMENGFDNIRFIPLESFDEFNTELVKKVILKCPTCEKVYKMRHHYEKHIAICVVQPKVEEEVKPPAQLAQPKVEEVKPLAPPKPTIIRDGFRYRCSDCRKGYLSRHNALKHIRNNECK